MEYTNLTFHRHPFYGWQATCQFANSFGLSILPEADEVTYEVGITRNGSLCYDSGLCDDVFRYLSRDSVNDLYHLVQTLPTPA